MTATRERPAVCPDPEVIAAFIDGTLGSQERAAVEAHLATCHECYELFVESAATQADLERVSPTSSSRSWYGIGAIAAAIVLAVSGLFWLQQARSGDPLDRLVAAVGTQRFVEARLSAGFAWGPVPAPMRGSAADASLEVQRAALALAEAAAARRTAETVHGAAIAALATGNTGEAIGLFEEAVRLAPDDPSIRLDLSAALLTRWRAQRAEQDATRARAEAETVLQQRPRDPAALFNHALALEAFDQRAAARAWQAYLDVDSSSPWAGEARDHLSRMKP